MSGADVLVVQGVEAGGHRGVFVYDDEQSELSFPVALQLIASEIDAPLGTVYLRYDEAGTSAVHRAAIGTTATTVLTRAFSGRIARGITNSWHRRHGAHAPRAYPQVHHLTAPLRTRGRELGDPDLVNLWAGQAHALATDGSARNITLRIAGEAARLVTPRDSPR